MPAFIVFALCAFLLLATGYAVFAYRYPHERFARMLQIVLLIAISVCCGYTLLHNTERGYAIQARV